MIKNKDMKQVSKAIAPMVLMREVKNGRIFYIEFDKKDGTPRKMTARKGVTKGVSGVGAKYDALERGYMTVFDMDKGGFRQVNLLRLKKFCVNGKKYTVK